MQQVSSAANSVLDSEITCSRRPFPNGLNVLFFAEGWGTGGIEAFIMSLVSSDVFRDANIGFEIYSVCDWSDRFDEEITALGGQRSVCISGSQAGIAEKYRKGPADFCRFLNGRHFDVVYVNATNGFSLIYAAIAQKCGVEAVVVHSHLAGFTRAERSVIKQLAHKAGQLRWCDSASVHLACSSKAGEWLFGKKGFVTVVNGVDVDRFAYNAANRNQIRKAIGVPEDAILLGNIGRIYEAKNPLFQIEVFAAFLKQQEQPSNSRYCFVGDGDLLTQARCLADGLGVADKVIFVPPTDNPAMYYSAFDLFVMPSFVEGFPLVAIEAQCSGLPILVSDRVTNEVDVTALVRHESLELSADKWAATVQRMLEQHISNNREAAWRKLVGTRCDSRVMAAEVLAAIHYAVSES